MYVCMYDMYCAHCMCVCTVCIVPIKRIACMYSMCCTYGTSIIHIVCMYSIYCTYGMYVHMHVQYVCIKLCFFNPRREGLQ